MFASRFGLLVVPVAGSGNAPWLDFAGVALVLVFLVLGARRGLWWQLVRLLGVVAAVAVARALAPRLAPSAQSLLPGLESGTALGLSWFTILLCGLLAVALIGRLGKSGLEAVELGTLDRFGGALAGALSGVLMHAALLIGMCQIAPARWSSSAIRGTHSQRLLDALDRNVPSLRSVRAADRDPERHAEQPSTSAPLQ